MELNKCLGCMEDFQDYPCPNCGFDPGKEQGNEYILPPQTILAGKYLVGKVLGQGGFGITYIGWDIALERKVAIKEYYPSGQVNRSPGTRTLTWYRSEQAQRARQDGLEMFLKEARKMSRVDNIPGVVRVRDLFRENDTAYIVMDFVEGETLKSRLKQTGPMSWEQAKDIFRPALRAMEQVHKAGLIHRDLSPDNLMLTKDGQVFILDLGAAKDLNVNQGASSMQVAKGGFSPFEQYTQRGGSGPWTDVYSMAATIYYTLTGVLPPSAIERLECDTISWDFPCLRCLPPDAVDALKKAMAVLSNQRIQSMDVLEMKLFSSSDQVSFAPHVEEDTLFWKAIHTMGQEQFDLALETLKQIPNYPGSKIFRDICQEKGTLAKAQTPTKSKARPENVLNNAIISPQEKVYQGAVQAMNQGQYSLAAESFQTIHGYRNSDAFWRTCQQKLVEVGKQTNNLKTGVIPGTTTSVSASNREDIYNEAVRFMNAGLYAQAQELFKKVTGYRTSDAFLRTCQQKMAGIK